MAAIVLAITTWAAPRKPMPLFFGHLRENGAQRWHAGAEGSSAQIREGCLSCVRYRVTAKSTRRIAMTTQILVRNIKGWNHAAIWLGSRKSPALPAGGRGRAISVLLWITRGRLARPFRTENNSGRGAWFLKKGPAEAGPSTRVISLRKEGYLGLPQLDNSAIRSAGTRFLQQRAVDVRVLPGSNRYPFPNRRTLDCGHKPIRPRLRPSPPARPPAAPAYIFLAHLI